MKSFIVDLTEMNWKEFKKQKKLVTLLVDHPEISEFISWHLSGVESLLDHIWNEANRQGVFKKEVKPKSKTKKKVKK